MLGLKGDNVQRLGICGVEKVISKQCKIQERLWATAPADSVWSSVVI